MALGQGPFPAAGATGPRVERPELASQQGLPQAATQAEPSQESQLLSASGPISRLPFLYLRSHTDNLIFKCQGIQLLFIRS